LAKTVKVTDNVGDQDMDERD